MPGTRVRNPMAVAVVATVLAGLVALLVLSLASGDDASDAEPAVLTLAPDGEAGPVPQADVAGEPAPDFTFEPLTGGADVDFATFRDGRPAVVNFFYRACPPCVREMPAFQRAFEDYGERVAFLGLSYQESVEDGLALVEQTGVTYPTGRDPAGDLITAFSGIGLPTTVFIAADGTITTSHTGEIQPDELRDELDELLA